MCEKKGEITMAMGRVVALPWLGRGQTHGDPGLIYTASSRFSPYVRFCQVVLHGAKLCAATTDSDAARNRAARGVMPPTKKNNEDIGMDFFCQDVKLAFLITQVSSPT